MDIDQYNSSATKQFWK